VIGYSVLTQLKTLFGIMYRYVVLFLV